MLNKETFINGITIMQKVFLNWTFNAKDPLQIQLWYQVFEGLSDNEFMGVIKTYSTTRIHPPQSPNELLMILAEEEEKKYDDPNKAFERVRQLIRCYGWEWGKEDIYVSIRDNPALYRTVKDMESELWELKSDDTFTPERFRKAYAINLKAMCMRKRDERLKLGVSQPKAIETEMGKGLPYET